MNKICANPHCGNEFIQTHNTQKYCCDKCAKYMHKHSHDIEKYKDKPCENCGKDHDHTYGSGRFCSEECKLEYIASTKRGVHNPKVIAHLDKLREEGKLPKKAPYGTWKCSICGFIAETKSELSNHMISVHDITPKTGKSFIHLDSGEYKCVYCGKVFNSRCGVIGHMTSCQNHPNKEMHDEAHKRSGKTYSQRVASGDIIPTFVGRKHTLETREKLSKILGI